MDNPILEELKELNYRSDLGEDITEEELNLAFNCLSSPDPEIVMFAGFVVTGQELDVIQRLFDQFDNLPKKSQVYLISLIAAIELKEATKFCFELLLKTHEPELMNMIIKSLAVSTYPIIPYLFLYLEQTNLDTVDRFKTLIFQIGFKKLEPVLRVFPELPQEALFREVFGDALINSLSTPQKSQ